MRREPDDLPSQLLPLWEGGGIYPLRARGFTKGEVSFRGFNSRLAHLRSEAVGSSDGRPWFKASSEVLRANLAAGAGAFFLAEAFF